MRPVRREEILAPPAYEAVRPQVRARAMAAKAPRRIHVGDHLTFLFENTVTIRHQIQEMVRAERIAREADIRHELDTYNALLGGPGQLGCTLLVEIDDPALRARRLREWFRLPEHVYARLDDATRIRPWFDETQRGEGRLSSVQYLKFPVGARVPVALGVDLPGLEAETVLTEAQRAALAADLAGGPEPETAPAAGPSPGQEERMTTRIGLPDEHRQAVAAILDRLLADEYVLSTRTRNYHWNVAGPLFAQLHAFFEKQYEQLDDIVDEVAERVRALGHPAAGTLAEFTRLTRLTETPGQLPDAEGMLRALLADHEAIVRRLREDLAACADRHGDQGTSDFLTGLMETHEKMAWMLRASLPG